MRTRHPLRLARARRALAKAFTATALATAASLVMSGAQTPALAATPAADPAPAPGYAVNGEVAHYDFAWSEPGYSPNTIEGGPRGTHQNGAFVGPGTDNESIWGIPGHTVRSLRLNGTNQYMSVPVTVPTEQSFSVSAWVQLNKPAGQSFSVVTEPGDRVSGFYLKLNPDGKPLFGMPRGDSEQTGWDTANGGVPLVQDQWTHLTGVYDSAAGQIRLYVNGTRVASTAHTATWHAAGQIEVGRGKWAGQAGDYFPGRLADVRVWQRALPDIEASDVAIADRVVRADRCTAGSYFHAGGPKLRALMSQALGGTVADTRYAAASAWGYGPAVVAMLDDERDQRALQDTELAREEAWTAVTKQFAVFGPDYISFLNKPGYGAPIWAFLGTGSVGPGEAPKPSQAALDRAIAISRERQAAEGNVQYSAYGLYANEDALRRMSSYQIARFIRQGGLPMVSPVKDSLEFRVEVEDLKAQWAGCDAGDPLDPGHKLDEVVATASAEWQAEQAAQGRQRGDILAADSQAYQDLRTATTAMVEAQGQGFIVSRMLAFQKYWQGKPTTESGYPTPQKFAQATTEMATARAAVSAQLTVAQKAAASAKSQADKAAAAQADAARIAAANGTPYGRGLAYAQQSVQVAKASAAAAQSASKAIETTLNTVSGTQADSQALYALADTQTHATAAEFQRVAAQEAAAQAKAAADAAAVQADLAAKAAARAKADREQAQQAEQTAQSAAADAKAQRGVAETERANAAAARQKADAERARAAQAESVAKTQQAAADSALQAARGQGQTALSRALAAEEAEGRANEARDAAATAEANRNAALSRAKALEAAAAAADGTADATAAREAATEARASAVRATDAAVGARSAADQAGAAAVSARTAATEADGASERANSASWAAQADAATTGAAAATAHAAAADAVEASAQAAQNVRNADAQVQKAGAASAKALVAARGARAEADLATADSARTAGQAYAASLAATAARDTSAAAAVAGNTAIALGTPFRETDASAALAVLVGQSGKTLAQQQADVATARAEEATRAARDAADAAARAGADAKAAAQASAAAAADAARAAVSLQKAQVSAAAAAKDARTAQESDVRTAEYDRQAHLDALQTALSARDAAADASAARASATDAEKDAASAHRAATGAENSASAARGTAATAERNATAAEASAANARNAAAEADQSAAAAEEEERREQQAAREAAMASGTTGVGGGSGAALSADDEQVLFAECGQSCVDEYRKARADADKDVIDWVKANGGQILLDVLGITDARKCFGSGDVEACLWTVVNVGSLLLVVGKLPAVSKAIVRIAGGLAKFFEEAEAGKRILDRLRAVVERARKAPKPPGCPTLPGTASARAAFAAPVERGPGGLLGPAAGGAGAFAVQPKGGAAATGAAATGGDAAAFAASAKAAAAKSVARASGNPEECLRLAITAGKNFKAHYLDHRALMEKVLGKKYPKWKTDEGAEFLGDLQEMIKSGRFKDEGLGTLNRDSGPGRVFRGEGLTLILTEGGEFWTLLQSGTGRDLAIQMLGAAG
ncbi:LamG domain-containing protein [Kitasatospora sp. NPDC088346]|uniref:LamG domain-containing protein n=1 Tax=Kitasatospora sp. NPDC088346 TaxID=3364073 RepID=UPI00380E5C3C